MVHGSLGLYWRFIGVILAVHWGYIPVHWGYIAGSSGLYFETKIVAYGCQTPSAQRRSDQ